MDFDDGSQSHPGFQEKGPSSGDSNDRGFSGQRDSSNFRNYNRSNSYSGGGGQYRQNNFRKNDRPAEPLDPEKVILYKPYTVTANKEIPEHISAKIKEYVKLLEKKNYVLRSGGMNGLEDEVEKVVSLKEVHLPWKGFAEKDSKFTYTSPTVKILAAKYMPGFEGLKTAVQGFLCKNVRMLMGTESKAPSLFMIVWTEDGCESTREKSPRTGPAGHPIAIASDLGIPIFNFGKPDAEQRLRKYLNLDHE